MTNIRLLAQSLPTFSRRATAVPAVSLSLLALLATSACGSDPEPQAADDSSSVASSAAADAPDAAPAADEAEESAPDGEAPDACSLLTVEDIKAATGATYSAGEGTDYDNTCRYDTSSDRVTVSISDLNGLEMAEPIGIDVVPVEGLPGATRVDAVVYVDLDGRWLSVGTDLPGFAASERDAAAAEALAKVAVSRL